MLYALIDKIKQQATPGSKGICPFCGEGMTAKCGYIKSWHWAHKRVNTCDTWYKTETDWHRKWKHIFGTDNCEVILEKNNQKHIADIQTTNGRIIELQNSPIDLETLESREEYYGNNMIWILNGINFIQNFIIRPHTFTEYDTYTPDFDRFAKINGFTTNYKSLNEERNERFEWSRPKKVWSYAKAKVYIDFGNEFLFLIKEGLGSSRGIGDSISKTQFILEHGGDISLLLTIITAE